MYEWLLDQAYKQRFEDAINNQKINQDETSVDRNFSMDEEEYEWFENMAESDEYVDFGIAKDADKGKLWSEQVLGVSTETKQVDDGEPVDLEQIFGGGTNG